VKIKDFHDGAGRGTLTPRKGKCPLPKVLPTPLKISKASLLYVFLLELTRTFSFSEKGLVFEPSRGHAPLA